MGPAVGLRGSQFRGADNNTSNNNNTNGNSNNNRNNNSNNTNNNDTNNTVIIIIKAIIVITMVVKNLCLGVCGDRGAGFQEPQLPHTILALIIIIEWGLGAHCTIIIIRNPQNCIGNCLGP